MIGDTAEGLTGSQIGQLLHRCGIDDPSPGISQRANALNRAIQLANQAIHEEAARNPIYAGMGSTIVAVLVEGNLFSLANVGDSRVYVIRGEAIQQLTNDHSLVMEQVRRGLITPEEAENRRYKTSSCGRWAQRRALSRISRTMSLRQETSYCFAVMACHATSRKAF